MYLNGFKSSTTLWCVDRIWRGESMFFFASIKTLIFLSEMFHACNSFKTSNRYCVTHLNGKYFSTDLYLLTSFIFSIFFHGFLQEDIFHILIWTFSFFHVTSSIFPHRFAFRSSNKLSRRPKNSKIQSEEELLPPEGDDKKGSKIGTLFFNYLCTEVCIRCLNWLVSH